MFYRLIGRLLYPPHDLGHFTIVGLRALSRGIYGTLSSAFEGSHVGGIVRVPNVSISSILDSINGLYFPILGHVLVLVNIVVVKGLICLHDGSDHLPLLR